MQSLEASCRKASDYFRSLGDKSRDHKNRERMYQLSLDTLCAAVWIENMRKFEFMFAQMYPECYEDVWRAVNDTVVSIDESSIYPKVLRSYHSTLAEEAMDDLISRQTLIDAFEEEFYYMMYSDDYKYMIKFFNNLPSADLSEYSDKLWKIAFERGKAEAQ